MQKSSTLNATVHVSPLGNGSNIASVVSRPSTSYQRKCFLAVTTSDTQREKRHNLFYFLYGCFVSACASQCVSVCHDGFLWCCYDNGLCSEGPFRAKNQPLVTENVASRRETRGPANVSSLREERQKKGWFMLKIKSGANGYWSKQCDFQYRSSNYKCSAYYCPVKYLSMERGEARDSHISTAPTIIGWKKEAAPSACKAPQPPMVEWDAVVHREILRHGCYLMLAISYLVIVELHLRTPIHTQLMGHWTLWLKHKRTLCSQQRNLILTVYT